MRTMRVIMCSWPYSLHFGRTQLQLPSEYRPPCKECPSCRPYRQLEWQSSLQHRCTMCTRTHFTTESWMQLPIRRGILRLCTNPHSPDQLHRFNNIRLRASLRAQRETTTERLRDDICSLCTPLKTSISCTNIKMCLKLPSLAKGDCTYFSDSAYMARMNNQRPVVSCGH